MINWTTQDPGVTGIDPQIVVDMVQKRAWLPLGALGVAIVVRLLKTDIRFFPNIPPRLRVWTALGLGQVAGILEAVIAGKTYKEAIVWGLVQSVIAIIGQNIFIDSLRGGKEIPIPGLTKANVAPSPGKPVTDDTYAKASRVPRDKPRVPAVGGTSPRDEPSAPQDKSTEESAKKD